MEEKSCFYYCRQSWRADSVCCVGSPSVQQRLRASEQSGPFKRPPPAWEAETLLAQPLWGRGDKVSVGRRGEELINDGRSICIFPLDLVRSSLEMRPAEGAGAGPADAQRVFHVVEGRVGG